MQLANLDNEIFFKKVFTDPEVFRAFVRDVTGVDVVDAKIETEKQLERKVAAIRFKLDIYAESADKRVLIEIQRVDYDYTFDRFLHYFLAALVDLQRSSKDYSFEQDVYTIIVLTAPYIVKAKNGQLLQDDVLISNLNPRTLQDQVREVYPHRLIFLNPSHTASETPAIIKDWLDFISESIKNPNNPKINLANPAIQKAAQLADIEQMPESVLEDAKKAEAGKKTKTIYEDLARQKERLEITKKMKDRGLSVADIVGFTGLGEEEVEEL
jgi:predicted transposase/invertase (TIGR01784 family)